MRESKFKESNLTLFTSQGKFFTSLLEYNNVY